jgi:5-methyltetrahydropteroyltriglutamate--homocysteine methyltransferase
VEVGSREALAFPGYYKAAAKKVDNPLPRPNAICTGPISYRNYQPLNRDIANFKEALSGSSVSGGFLASIAPADLAWIFENKHYASTEEYLFALGEAMRQEYLAIVAAGFSVQIDIPAFRAT